MLLAYIAVGLTTITSCNGSANVLEVVGVLGLVYAVLGNIWMGLGVVAVAYVEMVMVALVCMSGESLLDISLMGMQPKALAKLMHLQ